MGSTKTTAGPIKRAFPGRDRLIERAIADHASFRELCEDYRRCASALERWRGLDGEGPASRSREYERLLAELESEVETWFEVLERGSNGSDGVGSG